MRARSVPVCHFSGMFIPRTAHSEPHPSAGASDQRCLAPYAWLAAGVLVMGGAAALAQGAGTAHADATASSDSSHSAGPANRSSGRNAVHRPRAAAASARSGGTTPAGGSRQAAVPTAAATVAPAATATPATPGANAAATTTPGSASFSYTGASQTWQVPAGVQSASVQVQGGFGGPCGDPAGCVAPSYATPEWQYPANVNATVTLGGGITAFNIVVGGVGAGTDGKSGGAGGYNGGGAGGSGSDNGTGGAGGGGATSVYVTAGGQLSTVPILVAGGGGGPGGFYTYENASNLGGLGGSAVISPGPPTNSLWQGNAGGPGVGQSGDGGDGGQGGVIQGGIGQAGGDAEDLSGNAGGGGGGGGYLGGAGGQAGQTDVVTFRNPAGGGGGGSGSSYASAQATSNAYAAPAAGPLNQAGNDGNASVQWVSILSTALTPLTLGQVTSQQLQAYYAGSDQVTWQVSSGALPAGLTLSSTGVLAGTPAKLGRYSYQATVSSVEAPSVTSVMTYSGNVTAPTFRMVLQNIVRRLRDFIAQRPPCNRELRATR